MRAVWECENGDIGECVGINGYFRDFVDRFIPEHPDVVRIWCVMDERGEEWDESATPYWTADAAPYAVVKTWRDGTYDGSPETVTPYQSRAEAVRAAEIAWGYLTAQERRTHRVIAVEDYDGADWGRSDFIWDSKEACRWHSL